MEQLTEHTTPLWVTFGSLMWHSDPELVPFTPPTPDLLARWAALRELDLPDRQRARALLSRTLPHIRWPGETFAHAWRKLCGEDPPEVLAALEVWDGGNATYYRFAGDRAAVLYPTGELAILLPPSDPLDVA